MGLRIREREFNGLRWRRHATAQHSRIEIKKSSNESFAIAQHRPLDQSDLEFHTCVCQHPCFVPQSADKGYQVAVVYRASDLSHDKSLPGPRRVGVGEGKHLTFRHDVSDKRGTSRPAIDLPSQLSIENDGPF